MIRKNGMSLLQSFTEGPSLIAPQYAQSLRNLAEAPSESMMASLVRGVSAGLGLSAKSMREDSAPSMDAMCQSMGLGPSDRSKPFAFANGIALIPMYGTLLHRDNWCDSYATGYDFIRSRYQAAMQDPDVRGIVFDINSGGGHVSGNFELCDQMFADRGRKPTLALVDAACYSGAYSLATSMDRIVVTPSGGVGSIGVVMMHTSVQAVLEKHGVNITFIHAGSHKVDGNPFNDLPDDVRARYQASVERSYDKFVSLVARNRGIDADAVRATEALCYDADDALALGLIDAIQTPSEALAAFFLELDGSDTTPKNGATSMTTATAPGADATAVTAPAVTTPTTAATPVAIPVATGAPEVDAAQIERTRIAGIVGLEEANGRAALANHFAFNTTMSVDEARAALAAAPATTTAAAPAVSPFATAMRDTPNPEVGTGGGNGEEATQLSPGERIAKNYAGVTGFKLRGS